MTAQILDGKAISAKVRAEVKEQAHAFAASHGRPPGLQVVLVGQDPASEVYVRNKEKAAAKVGIAGGVQRLPATTPQSVLTELLDQLNQDPRVDGILVQMPLPAPLDAQAALARIGAAKDVDGLTTLSMGALCAAQPGLRPCTPAGCMRMLDEAGFDPSGKRAVVVGRSSLVGKPMAHLLLARHATVTIAHSRTKDLAGLVSEADLVVAAVGRTELVEGAWIRPGAVVLDVGINRGAGGKLRGDVEFEAARERASWITPVPGGVGPMTIAMLLSNTVEAAFARAS